MTPIGARTRARSRKATFNCDRCHQTYRTEEDLNEYEMEHFEQNNCSDCDKQLIRIGNRWYDLLVHLSENCVKKMPEMMFEEVVVIDEIIKTEEYMINDNQQQDLHEHESVTDSSCDDEFFADTNDVELNFETTTDVIETSVHAENEKRTNPQSKTDMQQPRTPSGDEIEVVLQAANEQNLEKNVSESNSGTKSNSKEFICRICDKICPTHKILKSHMYRHDKRYICDICGAKFSHFYLIKTHMSVHSGHKPFKCFKCKQTFMSRRAQLKHEKIHPEWKSKGANETDDIDDEGSDINMVVTENTQSVKETTVKKAKTKTDCKRQEKTSTKRRKHVEIIEEDCDEPIKCQICYRVIAANQFKQHLLKMHVPSTNIYPCSECDETYRSRRALAKHMNGHLKPHICEICGLRFPERCKLKNHMNSHTGNKPFKCDQCDERFQNYNERTSHRRTHITENKFKCDICTRAFKSFWLLKRHKTRLHNDFKQMHPCTVCSKQFAEMNYLRQHMKTHDPSKKSRCQLCGSTFYFDCNLRAHLKKAHGE